MKKLDLQILHPHRFWIGILIVAVFLVVSGPAALQRFMPEATQGLAQLRSQHAEAEQALRQLDDDMATVKKLQGQMSVDQATASLTPVNRLRIATMLERDAGENLIDHLTYTLSPEQKTRLQSPGGEAQDLATSTITIGGEAPQDVVVYRFIEAVRRGMPGRVSLRQFSIERSSHDETLAQNNVKFTASFEWLSNGAGKQMAAQP
jgi:Sec-independent protein translocase protein TatA